MTTNKDSTTPAVQTGGEAVEEAVPVRDSFEPFIFNDKPDKPLGWDESIKFAQSNYRSLDPRVDNSPRQMREKAISAWSFQSGAQWRSEQYRSDVENIIKEVLKRASHNARVRLYTVMGSIPNQKAEVDISSILATKYDDLLINTTLDL
jgi:hypothetical protein